MIRRLILAIAVILCVTSNCAADAVRKLPVVVASVADQEKQLQRINLLLIKSEVSILHARVEIELRRASDDATRSELKLQLKELKKKIQKVQHEIQALGK